MYAYISTLNYVLGRIEGIAAASDNGGVKDALFDTAELQAECISEIDGSLKPFEEEELIKKAKALGLSAEKMAPDGKGGFVRVPADF